MATSWPKPGTVRLGVNTPEETDKELRSIAGQLGMTKSAFVNKTLADAVTRFQARQALTRLIRDDD
jgi:hypothetical protein